MIRVALLGDDPAVLVRLAKLLEHTRGIGVLAVARDGVELARALGPNRPDVVVVDEDGASGDALALCRRIKARPEPLSVLVRSTSTRPALTARADGVIDAGAGVGALIDAIRQVAEDRTVTRT